MYALFMLLRFVASRPSYSVPWTVKLYIPKDFYCFFKNVLMNFLFYFYKCKYFCFTASLSDELLLC